MDDLNPLKQVQRAVKRKIWFVDSTRLKFSVPVVPNDSFNHTLELYECPICHRFCDPVKCERQRPHRRPTGGAIKNQLIYDLKNRPEILNRQQTQNWFIGCCGGSGSRKSAMFG